LLITFSVGTEVAGIANGSKFKLVFGKQGKDQVKIKF